METLELSLKNKVAKNNNMQKIVITGGLGYIGTELCKLYSGEARYKKIVVTDCRFVSERVTQLRDWGIDFIQAQLLDKNKMESILKDADIVYHLAGVTDVAYTKFESNDEKDRQIREVGVGGTQNVIDLVSDDCKIIFPSTHVVYEGLKEVKFNIDEDLETLPVLSYAESKAISEEDLLKSKKNFVILRLASVYGYSTDTMRINIMPNLFSKITSQNGAIKLFSGGNQYKSLIALLDVVRAMKFMGESDISREIFHISNENTTIKEVAQLCQKVNPKVELIETDDEVPNPGYTMSNKKLLATGFELRYNLEECITEMIHNWSEKEMPRDLEYLQKGEKEYIDERGKISNYELSEPINLIGYIESKAGTVRANHYHSIQEQKCLLISGEYISVTKDLQSPNLSIETRLVQAGDLSVVRPNVAHTMVFLKDSVFLNLVRGEREHHNYGITHTIPYTLVDDKFRKELIDNYKRDCRLCGSLNLKDVISLGLSPLANNLLESKDSETELFPLEMKYCPDCHNCQLSFVVPPEVMFDNYLYVSSTTKTFREHFKQAAQQYISEFGLTNDDLVVDIGSNDGVALKPFNDKGVRVLGVEPARNICEIATKNNIETVNSYFDDSAVDKILSEKGQASLVTASNVFAHSDCLKNITRNAFRLLKDDGCFIVEVQYLLDTIKDLTFDNIYHEHVNYWSVTSINNFFKNLNLSVFKVEHVDTHGGSIRVYVDGNNRSIDRSVADFVDEEKKFGITEYKTYTDFADKINDVKKIVIKNINNLKSQFGTIVGYASPAKATTSLNFFGIDNSYIDYIVEDNEMKSGKYVPGVNIPIKNKQYFNDNLPKVVIVMAWNFFEEIKKNNMDLVDKGIIFISIKDLQSNDFQI